MPFSHRTVHIRPDRPVQHRDIGTRLHRLPHSREHRLPIGRMNALDEGFERPAKRARLQAVLGFEGLGLSMHAGGVVHVPDPTSAASSANRVRASAFRSASALH
jgi:hypothetical protein